MTDAAIAEKALRDFLGTFAFTKRDMPDLQTLPIENVGLLAQELGWRAQIRGRLDMLINSTRDSWFKVEFNGVMLELPHYTMMTMRHCLQGGVESFLKLRVETNHWDRMKSEFLPGTLFLDVGAATGAMSVPYALSDVADLRIAAFEPSRRARNYLEATAARNGAKGITVIPCALSDTIGSFDFMELPEDESGDIPYLPEASRLQATGEALYQNAESYPVDVTTLDAMAAQLAFDNASRIVIKIDVEGFEDKVLLGALATLKRYKPFLSIDIHRHPGTTTMTDRACIDILEPLGYEIEPLGHVLLAR